MLVFSSPGQQPRCGTFFNSKRHGTGKLTFENGDVFDGTFVNGGVAGKGTYYVKSGIVFKGVFGRRPKPFEPPIENLDDTMLYRGLSTAHNLAPLSVKSLPRKRRLSTESETPLAEVADISEATPTRSATVKGSSAAAANVVLARSSSGAGGASSLQTPPLFEALHISHREILWGKGEICYPNGRRFNGRFENGEPLIKSGILWIPVKMRVDDDPDDVLFDTYTGDFASLGIPHGRGRMEGARGAIYEGQFYNGVPHGLVKETMADGEVYEGHVEFGERHGHGKLTMPNGDVYEGQFHEKMFEGRGLYYYGSVTYDGFFLAGLREGRGARPGAAYRLDGFWHDDQRCGVGVSWAPSGERQSVVLVGPDSGTPRTSSTTTCSPRLRIASLAPLCVLYETAQLAKPLPARGAANLSFVPGWLAAKRQQPLPRQTHRW